MNWYYRIVGDHVHVRVFTDEKLNGHLVFSKDEMLHMTDRIQHGLPMIDKLIDATTISTGMENVESPKAT